MSNTISMSDRISKWYNVRLNIHLSYNDPLEVVLLIIGTLGYGIGMWNHQWLAGIVAFLVVVLVGVDSVSIVHIGANHD